MASMGVYFMYFRGLGFIYILWIFLVFFSLTSVVKANDTVIEAVAVIKQQVVTSREVQIHYLLSEVILADIRATGKVSVPAVGSDEFRRELNGVILEWMVYFEARSFGVERVPNAEIVKLTQLVRERLATHRAWQNLEVGAAELREFLERSLWAKRFIQFKADSARVLPTDDEARKYYREHPEKFASHPYDYFEKSIKNYLRKEQANSRLKSWFQVLERRYQARSLLGGTTGKDARP